MSTKNVMILGEVFALSTPYVAGHVLTAAEAAALNQTRIENISNSFRQMLKAAQKNGSLEALDEVRAAMAKADASYEFGARRNAASKKDPIEREARNLARNAIRTMLREKGRKIKDIDAAKIEAAISAVAQTEDIINEACRIVENRKMTGKVSLAAIGLAA